ncbi:MAG: hypothetical protein LAO78_24875 [Acidobacteriia bacterium]|nr:hypothetical protein [Terriglobia bacterium]
MRLNFFDRVALGLATLFLGMIALRPLLAPDVAHAETPNSRLYVEPGTHTLIAPDRSRQVQGKVMIDLTTGNIWGFPTAPDLPYPIDTLKAQAATSSPMHLGKFDLSKMRP